jgi:hypothetical protein
MMGWRGVLDATLRSMAYRHPIATAVWRQTPSRGSPSGYMCHESSHRTACRRSDAAGPYLVAAFWEESNYLDLVFPG